MKTNAIVRIVIYSVVILLMIGLLAAVLGLGVFTFRIETGTSAYVTGGDSVSAAEVKEIEIDWASGSVTILAADTDQITFTESGNFDDDNAMAYDLKNGTLHLQYNKPSIYIGFTSIPSKDLVITVPRDWVCQELELDGAALDIEINDLTIGTLDMDGASNSVSINGAVEVLECDGASCEITLICTDRPRKIDLDGASCSLELTLPKDCGFLVQMDGLSCDFYSDLDYTGSNGDYLYGDRYCKINADGLSCEITIHEGK